MSEVDTDTYRTKDGEKFFTFSFFKQGDFYDIDATFSPEEINLGKHPMLCTPSQREGFTIISKHKSKDIFTAKLIAGEWAEKLYGEVGS